MKRIAAALFLVLIIAVFPAQANDNRYFYLFKPEQEMVVVLDGGQANVVAIARAKLGGINTPFQAADSRGLLLIYSQKKETGDQWVTLIDTTISLAGRRINLGVIPGGLTKKAAQWYQTPDSVAFFGNKDGDGIILIADLRTGEIETTKVKDEITDAAVGTNGHLYLGIDAPRKHKLCEYTFPDLAPVRSVPISHRPAAIVHQGQDLAVIEALPDKPARALKTPATGSLFIFDGEHKHVLHRYNLNLAEISAPEALGHAAWFWHPELEVLMIAAMNYAGPRTQGKSFDSFMLLYGRDGRCEVMPQAFFELFAFDPSWNYLYLGGLSGDSQSIIEINLADFSRRSAGQKGFGLTAKDKPVIQGFKAAYGGGSGITFYSDPSKVAVLDFARGLSRDFECDTGAGFGASFRYWLISQEESAVVYIQDRSQVVTYNNKAQKLHVFGFPEGNLTASIPFKAKSVVLIDADDGRHVIIRTPGSWQILDLGTLNFRLLLEEDGGDNDDAAHIVREPGRRTLYVLREKVCYLVDLSSLAVSARIPLVELKYEKEQNLSFGSRFSL